MNITVKDTSAAESIVRNYKMQWTLRLAKFRSRWLLYYVCAGVLIVMGIISEINEKKGVTESVTKIDLNPFFISLGIVMALYVLQYQFAWRKQNKINLAFLADESELLRKNNNESILTFSDEFVLTETYKETSQIGWEYFNYYSIHEDFLILHRNPSVIENVVVDRRLISTTEYDELLFFVTEKLQVHPS